MDNNNKVRVKQDFLKLVVTILEGYLEYKFLIHLLSKLSEKKKQLNALKLMFFTIYLLLLIILLITENLMLHLVFHEYLVF